uniref:InaF motif containing 2 n=1 Tax=Timema genevievae TaxID=629358 RepID=A0A7R9K120_TIMGE|nr:unnamed protein product [Timema genevievae]
MTGRLELESRSGLLKMIGTRNTSCDVVRRLVDCCMMGEGREVFLITASYLLFRWAGALNLRGPCAWHTWHMPQSGPVAQCTNALSLNYLVSSNAPHRPERLGGSATPTGVAVKRVSTRTSDSSSSAAAMSEHSDDDASLGDDGHQAPSGAKYAEDAAKDKLYEPKKARKIIRVLTVVAYVFSVSLAAIMLSLYYVFLWDPKMPTTGRQVAGQDPEPQPCVQHALLDTQPDLTCSNRRSGFATLRIFDVRISDALLMRAFPRSGAGCPAIGRRVVAGPHHYTPGVLSARGRPDKASARATKI